MPQSRKSTPPASPQTSAARSLAAAYSVEPPSYGPDLQAEDLLRAEQDTPEASISSDLAYLQTPAPVARPWGFRDVVATAYDEQGPGGSSWEVKVPGVLWCHYQTGPDLFVLARVVAELDPRAKWAGIKSLRACGFQGKLDRPEPVGNPAGYPFQVTLPVDSRYGRFGLQFTAFYRTFFCRQEQWGEGEEVRIGAVYRDAYGALQPLRNPYTLALLREALGLVAKDAPYPPDYTEEDHYRDRDRS